MTERLYQMLHILRFHPLLDAGMDASAYKTANADVLYLLSSPQNPAKRPRHTVLTTILYNSSYIHILIISIKNMQVQTVFLSEFIYMQSSIPQTTKYQPFTYYPISVYT